jgi:hypothetical protein
MLGEGGTATDWTDEAEIFFSPSSRSIAMIGSCTIKESQKIFLTGDITGYQTTQNFTYDIKLSVFLHKNAREKSYYRKKFLKMNFEGFLKRNSEIH